MTFLMMMLLSFCTSGNAFAISETVYVESPTDTDNDGKPDRIYVAIDRPDVTKKLSTLYYISPYALGGTEVPMHNVDLDLLPQDQKNLFKNMKTSSGVTHQIQIQRGRYATVRAHSLGTGYSTGCPTVGDMSETLAAKAVIDWLNGRAKAYYQDGKEALATWANGSVGMTGTSYDGTLPIMVATTGVEGLKAIVPVAAISSWYDYYRANGLVVNPGGYIGEDADILGYYIVRKGACQSSIQRLTQTQGRENGDYTKFWQDRDYIQYAKNVKAATFIIHGQSDWNVKQKHAIQFWEALEGVVPRRMFLHRGGHGSTMNHDVPRKVQAWFDHFIEGEDNGITKGPQVEVELSNGSLMTQEEWPNENTKTERLYFTSQGTLESHSGMGKLQLTDTGKTQEMKDLVARPNEQRTERLVFLSAPFQKSRVFSGTTHVNLNLSVKNRKAANITVAVVEYLKDGTSKIITRGWADPQNYRDHKQGEVLIPGQYYQLNFDLEPKQARFEAGSKLGIVIASTDYHYTLRPKEGTVIEVSLGPDSFVELDMTPE